MPDCHKELSELKQSLDRYRSLAPEEDKERERLIQLIREQAAALEMLEGSADCSDAEVARLVAAVDELEHALIPNGLHVVGEPIPPDERRDMLKTIVNLDVDMAEGSAGRVSGCSDERS